MLRIDHREDKALREHDWPFRVEVEQLPVGDYLVGHSIVIERKEINDFASSMDQRLWEQAHDIEEALASEDNSIKTAIVMIHGSPGNLRRPTPRRIDAIYGAISLYS